MPDESNVNHQVTPERTIDWGEYKAGLDKRLDSCKATATWSGIVFAVARFADNPDKQGYLFPAACILACGFMFAIYLQLSTGWHYSVLSGRKYRGILKLITTALAVPDLSELVQDKKQCVADRLDLLAALLGSLVYV